METFLRLSSVPEPGYTQRTTRKLTFTPMPRQGRRAQPGRARLPARTARDSAGAGMNDHDRGLRPSMRVTGLFMAILLAFIGLPLVAELYVDARWFASVGYLEVFVTRLGGKVGLAVVVALVMAAACS